MTETMRPYLRVSQDRHGHSTSTGEQGDVLTATADRRGWAMHPTPYLDRGLSASMYGDKPRPDFEQLLRDLSDGSFGATLLGIYESSRGSRQPAEWEELIRLAAAAGVRFWVETHQREYDPRNARDRRALREDAIDSAYESDKVSERVRRTAAAKAAEGRPWGNVPYGYRRVRDPRTGALLGQEPHPDEAPNVRDLFEKLADRWSLAAIAREWEARGVLNASGRPFSPVHLRQIAIKPAYAGRRVHHDQIYPAQWEPLVPPELFDTVQAILRDPTRKTTRAGLGIHLSTAVVRCGVCGGPTSSSERGGEPRHLRCHDRDCLQINQEFIDYLVEEAIIDALTDESLTRRPGGTDERLDQVRAELAAVRLQLTDLAAAVAARTISVLLAVSAEPPLRQELARLEALDRELSVPPVLSRFVAPADTEARKRWAGMPMSARRDAARALCVPGRLGVPTVHRTTDRGWCAAREHERPLQTCVHTVGRRLTWEDA
ncbi:recombinase family protein [Micromonospora sp. ANENR4]|uniref:recombinase family protein n=1 Tax=Micromonospora sp. ANENR4 TaxID=2783662 RepID=UPI00188E8DEB|nr:recombinase family protein [Micromonospora sp. ANENR4]MBF5029603.1 recombinase family protein [Micromonospora sp. ANENR4]